MREDWIECSLGEVLLHTKAKHKPIQIDNLFYVGLEHIEKETGRLTNSVKIDEIKTVKNKFESGQILYGKLRPYFNKVHLVNQSGVCSTDILVFQPTKLVQPKFALNYMMCRQFINEMSANMNGVNLPRVSTSTVTSYKFPLPPLVEQKAIVKKIEELFSSLDSGIADLKTAQDQLVIYRQAVLKKAFEGIKEFKPLKECGEWKGGGTPSRQIKEYWENGKIPWVSSRDVKTKEIHDTERHITEIAIPNSSTKWIAKDSLLFVMRSGILRRIFPIAIAKTKLCVNQDIQTVSLDKNWNTEYVYWFLVGNESDIRHSCSKDGTTVESIDANSLKAYLVPFCNLKEQHKIVQEIESRLSVCDKVEESIAESLKKAQALRQSILKKAFEGKLLNEEEIAKCKADTDYEPAGVLLERIKIEKNG